jgi:hypothetical protein
MNTKFLLIPLLTAMAFVACNKEEENDIEKPVVSGLEVGHGDTLHIGEGVHLEFEAVDNEALGYYRIVVHAEGEHKSTCGHDHWEYDSTFTENFSGLKNSTVHHHNIMVRDSVEEGHYHFHLTVADEAGNTTNIEKEVLLVEEEGEHGHEH